MLAHSAVAAVRVSVRVDMRKPRGIVELIFMGTAYNRPKAERQVKLRTPSPNLNTERQNHFPTHLQMCITSSAMTEQTPPHPQPQAPPPQSLAGTLPAFTPVPRKRARHDGWTPARQTGFIEQLAEFGSVRAAANAVGMTPESAYQLRRQLGADSFRDAWQAALDLGVKRIEDVTMDRALNGIEAPVYSYGKLVGTRRVYNDRLLMFMLRNRAPARFAEGTAKGMNALGKMETERLKKQWRAEWEAERNKVSPAQIRASIERKVEVLRQQVAAEQAAQWDALPKPLSKTATSVS